MLWGAFAPGGILPINVIDYKMNGKMYEYILGEHLLPNAPLVTSEKRIFQQGNTSIHVTQSTKAWFEDNDVQVTEWPSKSPDMNPVENLWAILMQSIYKDFRQYQTKRELIKYHQGCLQ